MKLFAYTIGILLIFIIGSHAQGGKSALFFDGYDDYVDCGNDSTLNLQTAFTLEVWIKGEPNNNSYARILDKFNFFNRQGYNIVRLPGSNSFMLDFFTTENSKHSVGGTTVVFESHWHHLAATFNGETVKIYIDGMLESTDFVDNKLVQICSYTFKIGNGFDGNIWFPYHGLIDEARVWNTALDSITIRDWMHKEVIDSHSDHNNLVGYWKFDEGTGSHTDDVSPQNNQGILINSDTSNVWVNSSVPLATDITNTMLNIASVWAGKDSVNSSISSLKIINVNMDGCIIWGHDGGDLTWTIEGIPTSLDIQSRLNRIWRVEIYDTISSNLIFSTSDLGITNGDDLNILIDSDGIFSDSDTLNGIFDEYTNTFTVHNCPIQHGQYYTLATRENLNVIESFPTLNTPVGYKLFQNFPNPFNPITTINFSIPKTDQVLIRIFNTDGERVATLVDKSFNPGTYQATFNAKDLSSGIYYYQIITRHFRQAKKMIVIK